MKFRKLEVDLAAMPGDLTLAPDEHGLALIVRRDRRPVGFRMQYAQPGTRFSADRLTALASDSAAINVMTDALRAELAPGDGDAPAPSVTIAICTRNRPALLARCLESIARVRARSAHAPTLVEILVVDNAPSDDRSARIVERTGGVRYVLEPRAGLDFARNAAWRTAAGAFVAYVDDDAVVDEVWLDGLQRALAANPDAGAVTGLVLPFTLDTRAQVLFEMRGGFRRGFEARRYAGRELLGDPYYPLGAGIFGAGCNMVIRRSLLESVGGFDEALDTGAPLPGGGDLDIFYHVIRAGAPLVYEPTMLVFHEHRREMHALLRQYYTWGLGLHAFLDKVARTYPEERGKIKGVRRWWVVHMLGQLVGRPVHWRFVVAELAGGAVGACGSYRRSQERSLKIRRAHA